MAGINSAYEQELNKRLGSGVATPYSGARTRGGEMFEGIASGVQGLGDFLKSTGIGGQQIGAAMNPEPGVSNTRYGPLEMLAIKGAQYFNAPSAGLLEEIETEKDIASGIGRPREIQEQIDIFESIPGADPLTVEQINQLSRNQSEGRKSKPFPTEQAARVKSGGRGKVNEQLGERENYQRAIDGPTPKEMALMEQAREQGQGGAELKEETVQKLFSESMADYLNAARTGAEDDLPEVRGIDDLKSEFAKATGIDISGKPDTSQALMAMGLSMMQNRAGKGFNVGRMLNAVGEAGEKAMPALAKANAEARNNVIAAGKYALTAQDADEKTRKAAEKDLMERGQFYVFEKGPKGKPYLNFDNGDLSYLNKSELNKLMNNKDFNDKYSFIAAKDYFDLQKESAAPKDLGNPYGKEKSVSLLGGDTEGVNPIYIVEAQQPDGNYKGSRKQFGYLQSNPESVVRNIVNEQQSILTEQKEFKSLIESVQSGVSIPKQIGSSIVQFGRNLGIDLGSGPTQIAQARKKLEKIQLLNATEILRESGKTLSDQDRERVKSFVGSIDLANADEALILQSIGRVYDIILGSRQRNLDTAVSNLETNFGIKFNAGTEKSSAITKEELEEINKTRQQNGLKPRTMDDYQ